jgi:hypothetical protein
MRKSNYHSDYPEPPYQGGSYLLSLRGPANWYIRRVCSKGKDAHETNVELILRILVDKIFGNEDQDDDIGHAFNMDCIVNKEAEFVQSELEYMILAQITAYFPKIGAELPDDYYYLEKRDLIIEVPDRYEDQRGYFF